MKVAVRHAVVTVLFHNRQAVVDVQAAEAIIPYRHRPHLRQVAAVPVAEPPLVPNRSTTRWVRIITRLRFLLRKARRLRRSNRSPAKRLPHLAASKSKRFTGCHDNFDPVPTLEIQNTPAILPVCFFSCATPLAVMFLK